MKMSKTHQLLAGDRSRQQIALVEIAAERLDQFELFRGFHALGHGGNAEVAREVDDSAHDGCVARITGESGNERAVDLDRVDREVFQVGQAGVPGTEIIQRDLETHLFEQPQLYPAVEHIRPSYHRSVSARIRFTTASRRTAWK